MKKIIMLLALFMSLGAFAQNFPGENVELLKDKTLKVLPKEESLQKYGYRDFYKDADLKKVYEKEGTSTAYKALVGKEFKVVSYESYICGGRYTKYKMLVENAETGKLYFDYDTKYSNSFPFEVIGGLNYPKDFFCNKIYEKEMKESTDRWYEAPVEEGIQPTISKSARADFFFLNINQPTGEKFQSGIVRRGLEITFANGSTISMPDEELKSAANPYGNLTVTALVSIYKPADLKLLQESKIVSVKLNKYGSDVKNGLTLQEYFKCLIGRMEVRDATAVKSTAKAVKSGGLNCPEIVTEKGKNEGEMHYSTPVVDGITVKKISRGGSDTYVCTLRIVSQTKQTGTFAMIMFDNVKSIDTPSAKIMEGVQKPKSYEYFAMFIIEEDQMNLFKERTVTGISVMDETALVKQKEKLKKLMTCLIDK
ncbi:hypothetical protein ACX0HA_04545 [Flavobacterium hauense]